MSIESLMTGLMSRQQAERSATNMHVIYAKKKKQYKVTHCGFTGGSVTFTE